MRTDGTGEEDGGQNLDYSSRIGSALLSLRMQELNRARGEGDVNGGDDVGGR